MADRPNVLILMCDQMRGDVVDPASPCKTPNFDRYLLERGSRITRGYTPNAICSPARASFMTGLLPHNHGVLTVTHCVDPDQSVLRTDKPHWAQRLRDAGYHTGYFGKWHVERSGDITPFGWNVDGHDHSDRFKQYVEKYGGGAHAHDKGKLVHKHEITGPRGYDPGLLYAVTEKPVEQRFLGIATRMTLDFLDEAIGRDEPWCAFVSSIEPHDPFVCGKEAYEQYDVDALALPPNTHDAGEDKPNVYRKTAQAYALMSDRQHREARACYFGMCTEIDEQYGRILRKLDEAGELDNTIVVLTSDHGDMLSAHGLYCKNIGGFEETYHIPMLLAGPGVPAGQTIDARVGLHDLASTLCELAGAEPIDHVDSRSFKPLLDDPANEAAGYQTGFAEFHGTRFIVGQRVAWDGPWKFCLNAFDFDELYHHDEDPYELRNLAADPQYADRVERMMKLIWRRIIETGDHTLHRHQYTGIRAQIPLGPGIVD